MFEHLLLLPSRGRGRPARARIRGGDVAGRAVGTSPAHQLSFPGDLGAEAWGDPERAARAWVDRLRLEGGSGRRARTARLVAAWTQAAGSNDPRGMYRAALALGWLLLEGGAGRAAAAAFAAAREAAATSVEEAWCLMAEARARAILGPTAPGIALCAAAMRRSRAPGEDRLRLRIHLAAASLCRMAGETERACRRADRARELAAATPAADIGPALRHEEGEILLARGRPDAAEAAFREAWTMFEELTASGAGLGLRPTAAAILRGWATALRACGRPQEARRKVELAMRRRVRGDAAERGRLRAIAAAELLDEGAEPEAWSRLALAERDLRLARAARDLAALLLLRCEARLLRSCERADRARVHEDLLEARLILSKTGDPAGLRRCDFLLASLFAGARSQGEPPGREATRPPRVPRTRRFTQLGFLTADPHILRALEPVESLARTSIPVLILGESGTGKEVLARAVHRAAGGRGPFVAVNCGALPTDLQESELFGHVRGAFTGAVADKVGLFEAADGGTLFLDEVGEMSPRAQVKLLRVLELGEVRRVGETRTRRVNVRVLAATNADLAHEILGGSFRRDLYYRLCGLKVVLPPLRRRMGDVPLLAMHFVHVFTPEEESAAALLPESLDRLLLHSWPGNVRELRFVMEKAVSLTRALGRSRIEPDCIDIEETTEVAGPRESVPATDDAGVSSGLTTVIENTERRLILKALEEHEWNRTRAARSLGGMSRTTLIGKMKRLGLFPGPEGNGAREAPGERATNSGLHDFGPEP
jgi:DNA-binding NtrC family response regulator